MRRIYSLLAALGMLAALFAAAPELKAQTADREGRTITAVEIKGNKAISSEIVLSKIKTKAGDPFSQLTLNDDLKRLYATEYFTNVTIDVDDRDGGIAVVFIVEEKPVIEDIEFKGNRVFRAQKLKAAMKSKPDEMLNLSLLASDIAELKNMYIKKGYPLVDITYKIDVGKELNMARIIITVDEKTRVKVAKVTIAGNKAVKTKEILKVMGTKPATWLWLLQPGIFKEEVFQDDLEQIKYLYDDKGFLDVELIPKMDYSEDGQQLFITIDIKEGKQYLVGDIVVRGNLVLPEKDIRRKIKMKPGKPFSNRALREDAVAVKQSFNHYGYMNAVVDIERNLNNETGKVDIIYNIDAKELVYVGKIEIRGNSKTKEVVVRRELRTYPGQKFDGDKIKRSKERLYNLGLFEDISFDTEETDDANVQNLIVNVKETKTGEFSFGGGYSSIDFLIGFIEVTQKNFDILNFPSFTGAGQRLDIRAELGMVRQDFNISWTEPWIFGYPFSFGFDLYQAGHKRRTDIGWAYDEQRLGGDLKLGKEITEHFRADLAYRLERVTIENVTDAASQDLKDETGSNWISAPTILLTQDTRDNLYNPGKGYILSASFEDAGGVFGGNKNFVKCTGTAAWYHTFFEKVVLELKGRGGLADAYDSSEKVPIYERFFAGGANTIRGYKERAVGPRDPGSNDPIGGEALLLGNAELTFPIYEKLLKGAVFFDFGNVWAHAEDFAWGGGYKAGAGVGIRVKTPVGPVRLDYGYPFSGTGDDKRQGEFYFSMSHGF
jgi:outer membrane protein insertion porin family